MNGGNLMFKKLLLIVKKVILATLFIYAYNVLAVPLEMIVPINLVTILIVSVLGIPGLGGLVMFSVLIC